jgi:hypothetical protein
VWSYSRAPHGDGVTEGDILQRHHVAPELSRYELHRVNYYEVPVHWSTLLTYYDLRARRYLVSGLDNSRTPYEFTDRADPREFSPIALNYYVR